MHSSSDSSSSDSAQAQRGTSSGGDRFSFSLRVPHSHTALSMHVPLAGIEADGLRRPALNLAAQFTDAVANSADTIAAPSTVYHLSPSLALLQARSRLEQNTNIINDPHHDANYRVIQRANTIPASPDDGVYPSSINNLAPSWQPRIVDDPGSGQLHAHPCNVVVQCFESRQSCASHVSSEKSMSGTVVQASRRRFVIATTLRCFFAGIVVGATLAVLALAILHGTSTEPTTAVVMLGAIYRSVVDLGVQVVDGVTTHLPPLALLAYRTAGEWSVRIGTLVTRTISPMLAHSAVDQWYASSRRLVTRTIPPMSAYGAVGEWYSSIRGVLTRAVSIMLLKAGG